MFFQFVKERHKEKKERLLMTKKLTIIYEVVHFLDLLITQIQKNERTQLEKDEIKRSIEKIQCMIDKMDF
jgi:hypothetical protein